MPNPSAFVAHAREKHAALTVNPSVANGDFYKLARASFPALCDVVDAVNRATVYMHHSPGCCHALRPCDCGKDDAVDALDRCLARLEVPE